MSAQQNAQPQQLRERISFRQGTPQEVTLEGDGNATHCAGQNGPEVRYFLQGHRIMWVPLEVGDLMTRAAAGQDATFAITKHKAPQPWTVIHLEDEPAAAQGNGWPGPEQQPAPRPAAAPRQQSAPRPRQEPTAGAPQQGTLPGEQPYSTQMYTALCAAIRVAAAAEDFAQKQVGRAVAFQTADVRAIAATLFIHATGGGR
jgi:hypothetical protein